MSIIASKASVLSLGTALFLLASHPVHAARVRDTEIATLAKRLFPVLTALDGAPIAAIGSAERSAVAEMLAGRWRRMSACGEVPACLFAAAAWTGEERDLLASSAERTVTQTPYAKTLIPDDGARAQILRELNGLNHIFEIYGLGAAPPYPEIDGPASGAGTPQFEARSADAVALGQAVKDDPVAAFDAGIGLALALLDADGRDDAGAFEPLDGRYNALARNRARTIDWSQYPYTAIIVPGMGPDDLSIPLSARGKLNVRLAATRFFDGVAPYIIVTGGAVHPRGTKHVEALEMRQALIDRFSIPPDCIIVEPYARHTTTNLRNATRLLAALDAPLDRDALIITNAEQSQYIESAEFAARNQRELGYQPGVVKTGLSRSEHAFRPARASLRVDPMDPLDP